MLIAKSELNNTNSMNVSTQVTNPLKAKNDTVNATDKDASLKNVVNEIREGTEIKETSKNESMPKAKNDTVNATDKDAALKNVVNEIREAVSRPAVRPGARPGVRKGGHPGQQKKQIKKKETKETKESK